MLDSMKMHHDDRRTIAECCRDIANTRRVRLEANPYYLIESGLSYVELPYDGFIEWRLVCGLRIPSNESWLDIAISSVGRHAELIDNALCRFRHGRLVEVRATHHEGSLFYTAVTE